MSNKFFFICMGIFIFFIFNNVATAEDAIVTIKYYAPDEHWIDSCNRTTIQGPYSGDKWVSCTVDGDIVTCEKNIKNGKKGIYTIEGTVSTRWKKSGGNSKVNVPYTIEVIFSGNNKDIQRRGKVTSSGNCNCSNLTSFSVK